jgi:hypothetical protein
MKVWVLDDRDGYLLLQRGDGRCAVIERRANHFYTLHAGDRPGVPCDLDLIDTIVDEQDWAPEKAARNTLDFAIRRGEELAQRIW